MSILQVVDRNGKLVVDSRLVADILGIQHKNFLATIEKYSHKMAASSVIQPPARETRVVKLPQGGSYEEKIAWLTEPQANFIMSLSRNTDEVVDCKLALVEAFEKAKEALKKQTPSMLSLPGEPYWYKRVKLFLAQNKVPDGYFSIFQETIGLVADIETAGYILPDNAIPDISIGKCWANHLRNTGIKPESISVLYKHQYPGWAYPIEAKAYLEDYLPPFRRWFRESYKTEKMPKYFKGKDQSALPAISKLLGLPAAIKI